MTEPTLKIYATYIRSQINKIRNSPPFQEIDI